MNQKKLPISVSEKAPSHWGDQMEAMVPVMKAQLEFQEHLLKMIGESFPMTIDSETFEKKGKFVSGKIGNCYPDRVKELLSVGEEVKLVSTLSVDSQKENFYEDPENVSYEENHTVDAIIKGIKIQNSADYMGKVEIFFELLRKGEITEKDLKIYLGNNSFENTVLEVQSLVDSVLQLEVPEDNKKPLLPPLETYLSGDFPKIERSEVTDQKEGLTESQNLAYQTGIDIEKHPVLFLHGGPGSGKTSVEVEIAKKHVEEGRRVLILSHSNKGSQVPMLKYAEILNNKHDAKKYMNVAGNSPDPVDSKLHQYRLRRGAPKFPTKKLQEIGNMTDGEFTQYLFETYEKKVGSTKELGALRKKEKGKIMDKFEELDKKYQEKIQDRLEKAGVTCSTFGSLLHDELLAKEEYDVVIVDEATRMRTPELLQALEKAGKKIIFVGDPLQLGNLPLKRNEKTYMQDHLNRRERLENTEKAIKGFENGPFVDSIQNSENPEEELPYVYLEENFRSKKNIVNVLSELMYEGKMKPARKVEEGDNGIIQWLDTQKIDSKEKSFGTSKRNSGEARFIAYKVRGMLLRKNNPVLPEDIAVIATYSEQAKAIRSELRRELDPELYEQIKENVATVDSFQGDERKVVFVSLTRSNEEGDIGFLEEERRIGVAVGRAQDECYIVGNAKTMTEDNTLPESKEYFGKLHTLIGDYGKVSELPKNTLKKINQNRRGRGGKKKRF